MKQWYEVKEDGHGGFQLIKYSQVAPGMFISEKVISVSVNRESQEEAAALLNEIHK